MIVDHVRDTDTSQLVNKGGISIHGPSMIKNDYVIKNC